MIEYITPKPPFDFKKILDRLNKTGKSRSTIVDSERVIYQQILQQDEKLIPVKVESKGTVEEPLLKLHYPDNLVENDRDNVKDTICLMFSTDLDLRGFYSFFSDDPVMSHIIQQLRGLRLPIEPNLFQVMVKTIIGQQLNLAFAATLVDRLISVAGTHKEYQRHHLTVFPSPEAVSRLSYQHLRALSFSQRKAEYIIDFARSIVDGSIDLNQFWQMTDEEITQQLLPMRGIGIWTIECFLIFGMGRPDLLPAADIGLRNAVKKAWNLTYQPSTEEVRRRGDEWSPHRTYATYYLWESLDI
jgi:DNA-3-methyladenine glycosylase II